MRTRKKADPQNGRFPLGAIADVAVRTDLCPLEATARPRREAAPGARSDRGRSRVLSRGYRWFDPISLQRRVTCELDFLDQGAELGYWVPDHGATRPVAVPRSGPSRVTAVANLLMTPIGLTLRPPRLLTSQSHFNRRYHGAYNDQLARNATSR